MSKDFIGFSFDNIHSSTLNILRVSDGDRYEEELHPDINDRTLEITGLDGEYFFGTNFAPKEISISIAFDSVTEKQFRQIRRLFGTKKVCDLIFDERPYKVYKAKVKEPVELEYICFDEPKRTVADARDGIRRVDRGTQDEGWEQITPYEYSDEKQRIYKGEGKINFICYFPFAKQLYKTLEKYENSGEKTDEGNTFTSYSNVDEWKESSGLLTTKQFEDNHIDQVRQTEEAKSAGWSVVGISEVGDELTEITEDFDFNGVINVYNPGDLDVGFYLYIPFVNGVIIPCIGNYIRIYGDDNGLLLNPIYMRKNSADTGILINTTNHLIEGVIFDTILANRDEPRGKKPWVKTGSLYNEYIVAGDFPHIKRSNWYIDSEEITQAIYLNINNACVVNNESVNNSSINETVVDEGTVADTPVDENPTNNSTVSEDIISNRVYIDYDYLYF